MRHLVVDSLDIAIGIISTVSLSLGSAGFAVLVVLRSVLSKETVSAIAGGCLAVAVLSRISLFCLNGNVGGIVLCAVALTSCVIASIYSFRELESEYGYFWNDNVNDSVSAALTIIIVFTALELGIATIIWWKRSKQTNVFKHNNLSCLEEEPIDEIDVRYQRLQTPIEVNNDVLSNQTRTTQDTASREKHKRHGSKVNLWDDDVITTARIPKDKILMDNLISQGGYGEVYKGTFNGLSVAVKRMLPAHRKSVAHVNNFLAEVKLMASLDHSRIVQFVGVAWDALSDVCAVIEFMDGGDLRGLLTSYHNHHHPVGFDCDKVKIALHVAHALTYLHSLSPVVIHRDLKSRNILLTSDLDAKLTDFGVSRERVDHTMTAGVGTSLWMAPEVLMGERYDDKADIFSFGVVLSELDLQVLPYSHATDSDGSGHRMRDLAILQRMAMGKLRVQFSAVQATDNST
ncbi:TKL protein kinase [Phytophthora nicotianae INRA-310]|uniref:TKL protein kinase n=1 Tax=Phytophthora nicotianae (strain INRA-310) TaxID=761204 RepID=W2QRM4_PHYN3|nr:TKL protein kinase [Phytophthora nicotianae INRA-310]ETN15611.1 TKL protein kinase [Phytophthora nicotianae INRA-310]